ncbi:MAG: hypothetical protein JXB47_08525 [Anaerolineae bacterium]|nr:hypothetical protein [Anaerolineae bacterium]
MHIHTLTEPWRVAPLPLAGAPPSRRTLAHPGDDAERAAYAAPGLDDGGWRTVPQATHLQPCFYPDNPYWGEHLRELNESVWVYRLRIAPGDIPPGRRCRLRFDGVDYYAEVWLNGAYVGRHEGNFAPFAFDVTRHLHTDRANLLAVVVAAPWDPPAGGASPVDRVRRGMVKGLYEHAEGVIPPDVNPVGVWQPVHLVADDGVSIEDVRIRTRIDGAVTVRFTVENAAGAVQRLRAALEIDPENHDGPGARATIDIEAAPGCTEVEHVLKLAEPRLWQPWDRGAPNLYTLAISLQDGLAQRAVTFGVREVRLARRPDGFTYYLNDRPVFVRGAAYIPDLYLSRVTEATLARDFDAIIDAGLNLARIHVHVAPALLYDMADRRGLLLWQDFELNWLHEYSAEFEARAVSLQRAMIRALGNHPSVITWCCYNEPTMVFAARENLLLRPCPALYADALAQDPTRPVFICSGQRAHDLARSGDVHTYYGAIWSKLYTDAFHDRARLNTEFGFEAPADPETLRAWPDLWERTKHLAPEIAALWEYQFELTRYHIEHYRRIRFAPCGGYVHFWLADLAPGVGCGVFDALRRPKGGYAALKLASQPVHFFMEHDGRRALALWAVNDSPDDLWNLTAAWAVQDAHGQPIAEDAETIHLPAGALVKVRGIAEAWPGDCTVTLALTSAVGEALVNNVYERPFQVRKRPAGYPWNYDPYLGVKVFDRPGAHSLMTPANHPLLRPLKPLLHAAAEWGLRQPLPPRAVHRIGQLLELLGGKKPLPELRQR